MADNKELKEKAKQIADDIVEAADQTRAAVEDVVEGVQEAREQLHDKVADKLDDATEHFAKAGKRSEKSVKAAEEEAERQARKEAGDTTPQDGAVANVEKGPAPKTRPLAERKGKNYKKVAAKVDKTKVYSLADGIKLATETATTKFDSTVEIHVRLGVDPKQADQNIRTTVVLPNGTGKTIRVAALVGEDMEADAKKAGADYAGEGEIMPMLEKENLDFDVLIATPQYMPKLGRFARLLGPRGLMPNPKAGTVSANPAEAIKEAKAGKVEYRVDKQGNVHLGIGKVSFGVDKLVENANVFVNSLKAAKPTTLKGNYILSAAVSTTMGPGVKVNID
jgi:large subunit ribosomal protein L1